MTRFLLPMMLMASLASAGPHERAQDVASGAAARLPPEVVQAFEAVALATEARAGARDVAAADAQAARALEALAASVQLVPDAAAFVDFVQLDAMVVGGLMRVRLRGGLPADGDAVARAMDRLLAAKRDWLATELHSGSLGPSFTCFEDLANCWEFCAGKPSALQRSACGLDCEVDFLACLGAAISPLSNLVRVVEALQPAQPRP